MASLPQIKYEQMERERLVSSQAELKKELQSRAGIGESQNGVLRETLKLVTEGKYETAEKEIFSYIASRKNYRNFQSRCKPYAKCCKSLIRSIQEKREFSGLQTLSLSKQQEFHDKVLEHFDELKDYLKQIERVEQDVYLKDLRSTTWFIRTIFQCVVVILGLAFFLDLTEGTARSLALVVNQLLNDMATWLVSFI